MFFDNGKSSFKNYKNQKIHTVYALLGWRVVLQCVWYVPLTYYHRGNVCLRDDTGGLDEKFGYARRSSVRVRQKHACPPPSLISRWRGLYAHCDFSTDGYMYAGQYGKVQPETYNAFLARKTTDYFLRLHRFIVKCLFCESGPRADVCVYIYT